MKYKNGNGRKGEIISAVIVIGVVVASAVIVVNMVKPMLEEGDVYQDFNQAKQAMSSLDEVLRELAVEATGSTRTVTLNTYGGEFEVSGRGDQIKFKMDKPLPNFEPGTSTKEGNLIISYGPNIIAQEFDINSDGSNELVFENDALLFAIKKYGNSTNATSINTTDMIALMRNKRTNTDVIPKSGIFLNALDNSSYGNGYTEMTRTGRTLSSSSIRLVMNSTAGINYEAIFSIQSGQDFVSMEVRNIKIII